MELTLDFLENIKSCPEGIDFFNGEEDKDIASLTYKALDLDKYWLAEFVGMHRMNKVQQIEFLTAKIEKVIELWEDEETEQVVKDELKFVKAAIKQLKDKKLKTKKLSRFRGKKRVTIPGLEGAVNMLLLFDLDDTGIKSMPEIAVLLDSSFPRKLIYDEQEELCIIAMDILGDKKTPK